MAIQNHPVTVLADYPTEAEIQELFIDILINARYILVNSTVSRALTELETQWQTQIQTYPRLTVGYAQIYTDHLQAEVIAQVKYSEQLEQLLILLENKVIRLGML